MKRIFLLFLVLAFLRISIYAQHSFPPTHSTWGNLKVTQVELTQETETSTIWMLEMIY